jgi:hypothetical protein
MHRDFKENPAYWVDRYEELLFLLQAVVDVHSNTEWADSPTYQRIVNILIEDGG